eukprot:scaffold334_cov241-Pinguiococcus_pyrenoidosus.AAC.74
MQFTSRHSRNPWADEEGPQRHGAGGRWVASTYIDGLQELPQVAIAAVDDAAEDARQLGSVGQDGHEALELVKVEHVVAVGVHLLHDARDRPLVAVEVHALDELDDLLDGQAVVPIAVSDVPLHAEVARRLVLLRMARVCVLDERLEADVPHGAGIQVRQDEVDRPAVLTHEGKRPLLGPNGSGGVASAPHAAADTPVRGGHAEGGGGLAPLDPNHCFERNGAVPLSAQHPFRLPPQLERPLRLLQPEAPEQARPAITALRGTRRAS